MFWYCKGCKEHIQEHNLRDLTFDEVLIDFLAKGTVPDSESEERRCREAAKFLKWDEDALYINKHDEWLQVPAVAVRQELIEERHVLLRHAGVNKLMGSLKLEFWWNGMIDDISRVVRECDCC